MPEEIIAALRVAQFVLLYDHQNKKVVDLQIITVDESWRFWTIDLQTAYHVVDHLLDWNYEVAFNGELMLEKPR